MLCIAVLQRMHARGRPKPELLEMMQWFLVCVLVGLEQIHEQVSSQVLHATVAQQFSAGI
jgi:hypothetical protein